MLWMLWLKKIMLRHQLLLVPRHILPSLLLFFSQSPIVCNYQTDPFSINIEHRLKISERELFLMGLAFILMQHNRVDWLSLRADCFLYSVGFWSKAPKNTFSGPWGTAVALWHEYLTTLQRIVNSVKCKRGCAHDYHGADFHPLNLQSSCAPPRAHPPSAHVNDWPWGACM